MEQDVGGREANSHTINQQRARVRDQGDALQETKYYLDLPVCEVQVQQLSNVKITHQDPTHHQMRWVGSNIYAAKFTQNLECQ